MLASSRAFFVCMASAGLYACQPQPAETAAPPPAATAPAPAPTAAQQLSPILSGCWVAADYLEAVARTRSPERASESFPDGPVAIFISPAPADAASVRAGVVYNMHEGGEVTVLFQAGQGPHSVRVKLGHEDNTTSELVYHISPTDTTLALLTRGPKQQTRRITYRRTLRANQQAALRDGVDYALNRLLVAGSYIGTDSLGHSVKASFTATGRVAGLPFTTYEVHADFFSPSIGNEVIFDSKTKDRSELAAVFGRDTLRLFSIHESVYYAAASTDSMRIDSAYNFQRGRLRYQLVRAGRP